MQITPLTPTIGAELSGIDLTRQLDDATVAAIRQALLDHQVIFMRDQPLDPDGLAAFAERFGPLYVQPDGWSQYVVPHVMTVHMDGDTKVHAGPQWHSDLSCAEHPPMGSILHNHQIPESGGDTLFANMAAAFAALSLPLRRWLETLTAVHSYVYDDGSWPEVRAEHPAITTHPETGAKVLYVNRSYTSHIK
ncbi:MAG: taurine dioxygenase, partial [Rhodospirillaceae bacterium]|nr:taurine dioxygenase [Rhodospirillaceae bacterium]